MAAHLAIRMATMFNNDDEEWADPFVIL
jgi:hypothetical protein